MRLVNQRITALQFLSELEGFAVCDPIHQRPEAVAVVQLDGVAKLMQQDVVDEVPGEGHQQEGEVDMPPAATTAPSTTRVLDGDTVVMEPMLAGECRQSVGQAAFRLMPQGGFEQLAQVLLGLFLLEACLPRAADQQLTLPQAQLEVRLLMAADPHPEGGA